MVFRKNKKKLFIIGHFFIIISKILYTQLYKQQNFFKWYQLYFLCILIKLFFWKFWSSILFHWFINYFPLKFSIWIISLNWNIWYKFNFKELNIFFQLSFDTLKSVIYRNAPKKFFGINLQNWWQTQLIILILTYNYQNKYYYRNLLL